MFENLRDAFREAVENFRTELTRDEVPAAADRLLKAMESEVGQARAELRNLKDEAAQVEKRAAREEAEARTCIRREEMARRIGDEETVEVARDYARRHLKLKEVLDEKGRVLTREIQVREREVMEMEERLREALTRKESLIASAGRMEAHHRIQDADDLFQEMDRMADRIQDLEARVAAAGELDEMELGDGPRGSPSPDPSEAEIEARLAALKRQMGKN
jgi:phage shock protein A